MGKLCIVNKSVENNQKAQKLISYNLLGVYFLKYVLIYKGAGEVYLKRSKIVSTLVVIWYTIELNAKKCVSSKKNLGEEERVLKIDHAK